VQRGQLQQGPWEGLDDCGGCGGDARRGGPVGTATGVSPDSQPGVRGDGLFVVARVCSAAEAGTGSERRLLSARVRRAHPEPRHAPPCSPISSWASQCGRECAQVWNCKERERAWTETETETTSNAGLPWPMAHGTWHITHPLQARPSFITP
jgi:hypothetical protein